MKRTITYKAWKSAKTGQFVSAKYAKKHPKTTYQLTVKFKREY